MERDNEMIGESAVVNDFNSHAHVERDLYQHLTLLSQFDISTHTLTWSVTAAGVIREPRRMISTHTLTWSVTIPFTIIHRISRISTHTLTWSVTNRSLMT